MLVLYHRTVTGYNTNTVSWADFISQYVSTAQANLSMAKAFRTIR